MLSIALFLGISLLLMGILIGIQQKKQVHFHTLMGLFVAGIIVSMPFLFVEHLGFKLKYYFVILAFIAIESAILYLENRVKPFHDLLHHNIPKLRMVSYLIMGIGFTFSEISFYIFSHAHDGVVMGALMIKTLYAVFMHTVLTSAAGIAHLAEAVVETSQAIFRMLSYYIKIAIISVSHYLYIFFLEHKFTLLMIPFILLNIYLFFRLKKYLDHKIALKALQA